jgi:glycosyltransferase involved in cell wall biosynthesis
MNLRERLSQGGIAEPGRIAAPEPAAPDPITVYDYEQAARFVTSRVFVTPSVVWHRPKYLAWLPSLVWAKARQMASHLQLIGTTYRHRDLDLILVKGFSTTMLAAIAPFVWHARRRMLLTMHHNLQFAHRRPLERWILRLLCRARFRFAVLDALDGVAELGIEPDRRQFFVLHPPIPAPASIAASALRAARPTGVGVIGSFRGEKNTEDLLQLLVEARDRGDIETRIVLGCPNDLLLQKWRAARVDGINTADYRDYLAALASCEVVVLNYQAAQYYYRSSGVIGDAVALGAAVACPDFPVFRSQITEPVTVGAVFRDPEDLVRAVQAALELRHSKPENLVIWADARTPQEFSRRLDEFIAATDSAQARWVDP